MQASSKFTDEGPAGLLTTRARSSSFGEKLIRTQGPQQVLVLSMSVHTGEVSARAEITGGHEDPY